MHNGDILRILERKRRFSTFCSFPHLLRTSHSPAIYLVTISLFPIRLQSSPPATELGTATDIPLFNFILSKILCCYSSSRELLLRNYCSLLSSARSLEWEWLLPHHRPSSPSSVTIFNDNSKSNSSCLLLPRRERGNRGNEDGNDKNMPR